MEWTEYIKEELLKPSKIKGLQIKVSDNQYSFLVPSIIRISLDILNRFLLADEKRLIMVFPEGSLSPFLMITLKIVSDILEGNIKSTYDPCSFQKGQKLKCEDCVVEFDRIESENDAVMLYVRDADCTTGIPIGAAPMFQLTDTNRRLSKDIKFSIIRKRLREQFATQTTGFEELSVLIENKTHFDNTIFAVSPIGKTQMYFDSIKINSKSVKELLLIGHANEEGVVEVTGKGQLAGKPQIVLAADLYAVCEAIKKAAEVKMLLIDISNSNILTGQLDAIDELKAEGFPIVCVTDTVNSFNLSTLEERGFFVWRWDYESLSESLISGPINQVVGKANVCFSQKVSYIEEPYPLIDEVLTILYEIREIVSSSTGNITMIYDKLFTLESLYLRAIIPFTQDENITNKHTLDWSVEKLTEEKHYCDPQLFEALSKVIEILEKQNSAMATLPKIEGLKRLIMDNNSSKCCIIPEKSNKEKHSNYWNHFCRENHVQSTIIFVTSDEYINEENILAETTVVCGWIGKDKMRKILFSYKTENVVVLLYGYEKRWQTSHMKSWEKILHNGNKQKIAERILWTPDGDKHIFTSSNTEDQQVDAPDELEEINIILRENQYKRYLIHCGTNQMEDTAEAIPVNFIGGFLSFYKLTHKLISVGDIVLKGKNEIFMLYPSDLHVGDFIVVREAERDIVRELADTILAASGKQEARKTALKWRESLELESIFTSFDEIYNRLQKAGCSRKKITVRQWISNEDIITPQEKADLMFIAQITDDDVLKERVEEVFEAGKVVRSAHVQAGRNLSVLLKSQVVAQLKEMGEIDPYNIWEPIDMHIDGIVNVKLLKVIDVGNKMTVDCSNINRLMREF